MREVIGAALRDADGAQHLLCLLKGLLLGDMLVEFDAFADLIADSHDRVQRGHRVLENHGHFVAAHFLQLFRLHCQDVLPVQPDLAAFDFPRRVWYQVENRARRSRFTRAGLSDEAQRAASADAEADAVDGMYVGVLRLVADDQIPNIQNSIVIHLSSSSYFFSFGSSASRRPSPRRFRASTVSMTARPGITHI